MLLDGASGVKARRLWSWRGDNRRDDRAPLAQRHASCAPACAQPTDAHADLADAPGGPLPARVPRHARARRQLHGPGDEPRIRDRGDAAAARALSARCGDPVQRHPHRARRDGPRAVRSPHGEGPRFARPVRDEADVAQLAVPDMARLRYVFDAVASIRKALAGRVPLIGFSGSPWTLACYMVEGAGSDDYRLVKTMLYQRPDLMHRILAVNADAVARLPERADRRRRAGGDDLRQLGRRARRRRVPDLQPRLHARACCASCKRDADGRRVPHIVFTKGGGLWLDEIAASGADVVGLDWTVNLGAARARVGQRRRAARQSRPGRAVRRRRRDPARGASVLASFGPPPAKRQRPRLQSRPRHQPAHAARERSACSVDAVHALSRIDAAPA